MLHGKILPRCDKEFEGSRQQSIGLLDGQFVGCPVVLLSAPGKIAISQKLAERHRVALEAWIQTQFPQAPKRPAEESSSEADMEDLPLALEDRPRQKAPRARTASAKPPKSAVRSNGPSKGIIARRSRVRYYQVHGVMSDGCHLLRDTT